MIDCLRFREDPKTDGQVRMALSNIRCFAIATATAAAVSARRPLEVTRDSGMRAKWEKLRAQSGSQSVSQRISVNRRIGT